MPVNTSEHNHQRGTIMQGCSSGMQAFMVASNSAVRLKAPSVGGKIDLILEM